MFLKKTRILIPYGSRACMNHLNGSTIDYDSILQLKPYKNTFTLNNSNIGSFQVLFDGLTNDVINTDLFSQFRLINSLNEKLCVAKTGYNIFEFQDI